MFHFRFGEQNDHLILCSWMLSFYGSARDLRSVDFSCVVSFTFRGEGTANQIKGPLFGYRGSCRLSIFGDARQSLRLGLGLCPLLATTFFRRPFWIEASISLFSILQSSMLWALQQCYEQYLLWLDHIGSLFFCCSRGDA